METFVANFVLGVDTISQTLRDVSNELRGVNASAAAAGLQGIRTASAALDKMDSQQQIPSGMGEKITALKKRFNDFSTGGVIPTAAELRQLAIQTKRLGPEFDSISNGLNKSSRSLRQQEMNIRRLSGEQQNLTHNTQTFMAKQAQAQPVMSALSTAAQGMMMGFSAATGSIQGMLFGLVFMRFAVWDTRTAVLALAGALGILIPMTIGNFLTAAIKAGDQSLRLRNDLMAAGVGADLLGRWLDKAKKASTELGLPLETIVGSMTDLNRVGLLGDNIIDSILTGAIAKGGDAAKNVDVLTKAFMGLAKKDIYGRPAPSFTGFEEFGFTEQFVKQQGTMANMATAVMNKFADTAKARQEELGTTWNKMGEGFKGITTIFGEEFNKGMKPVLDELLKSNKELLDSFEEYRPAIQTLGWFIGKILTWSLQGLAAGIKAVVGPFKILQSLMKPGGFIDIKNAIGGILDMFTNLAGFFTSPIGATAIGVLVALATKNPVLGLKVAGGLLAGGFTLKTIQDLLGGEEAKKGAEEKLTGAGVPQGALDIGGVISQLIGGWLGGKGISIALEKLFTTTIAPKVGQLVLPGFTAAVAKIPLPWWLKGILMAAGIGMGTWAGGEAWQGAEQLAANLIVPNSSRDTPGARGIMERQMGYSMPLFGPILQLQDTLANLIGNVFGGRQAQAAGLPGSITINVSDSVVTSDASLRNLADRIWALLTQDARYRQRFGEFGG